MKTSCARTSRRRGKKRDETCARFFPFVFDSTSTRFGRKKKKEKAFKCGHPRNYFRLSSREKKKKDEQKRKKLLIIINVYIPSDPEKSCPDLRLFSVSMRAGEIKILIFTRSTPPRGRTARPVKRFSPTDMHTRIQRRGRRRLTVDNTYLENPLHGA